MKTPDSQTKDKTVSKICFHWAYNASQFYMTLATLRKDEIEYQTKQTAEMEKCGTWMIGVSQRHATRLANILNSIK